MAAQPQTTQHLDRALALLRERRAEDALDVLLEAWRGERAAEIAELISTLSDRLAKTRAPLDTRSLNEGLTRWLALSRQDDPADLGRLLDAYEVAAKKQIHTRFLVPRLDEILRRGDDPRVVLPLVRTLDVLPLVSHATQIAHRVFRGLLVANDPRAIPVLAERISNWRAMNHPPEQFGGKVRVYVLVRGAEALEKLVARHRDGAPQLADEARPALEAIAAALASLPKDLVRRVVDPTKRSIEELFAAVYQSPDDDELRDVLADALQLRQDPRGEFIALQMARHRGQPVPGASSREEALLRKHRKQWLGPLEGSVHPKEHVFRRGFLDECRVRFRNAAHARAEGHHVEWATVRTLEFCKGTHELVTPAMRSIRSLRGVITDATLASVCSSRLLHLTELSVQLDDWAPTPPVADGRPSTPGLATFADTHLPELRVLTLVSNPDGSLPVGVERIVRTADDYRWLVSAPWAATLRSLSLNVRPSAKASFVALVADLPRLETLRFLDNACPIYALEPVADGVAALVWLFKGVRCHYANFDSQRVALDITATALASSLSPFVRTPRVVELRLCGPSLRDPERDRIGYEDWVFEYAHVLARRALEAVAHRPDLRVFGPGGARLDAGGRSP